MAANFWTSSQKKLWLLTKEQLSQCHKKDREKFHLTDDDLFRLKYYHIGYLLVIQALGKILSMRQRVIATAMSFFRRVYVKHNFAEFCPRLIVVTCLYVAAKAEETSTQAPAYKVINEMKKVDQHFPYSTKDILDCELYLIEALEFNLIVYHPYKSLIPLLRDCQLEKTEMASTTWALINDSYYTEVPLLFAPYIVCLGCIYIASIYHSVDLRFWFSELAVDMKEILQVSSEILDYYEFRKKDTKQDIIKVLLKLPWYSQNSLPKSL